MNGLNKINVQWHDRHIMPKHPSPHERLVWHAEHAKHCACRPLSDKLRQQLRTAGLL